MTYESVPVPARAVPDVMQFVANLVNQGEVVPWTREELDEVLSTVDNDVLLALECLADATFAYSSVAFTDVALIAHKSEDDLTEILRELNVAARALGRANITLPSVAQVDDPELGLVDVKIRTMPLPVAEWIKLRADPPVAETSPPETRPPETSPPETN